MKLTESQKLALPSRLRESAFRRYERDIATILNFAPEVVISHPSGNIQTYVARLRDAQVSYDRFSWDSTLISRAVFERLNPSIVIRPQTDGTVVAGTREAVATFLKTGVGEATPVDEAFVQAPHDLGAIILGPETASFLAALCAARVLAKPVKFFAPLDAKQLEQDFDVRVDKNADGSFTIS